MKPNPTTIILLIGLISHCTSYDISFDSDRDVGQWKFNGSYIYSRNMQNVAALIPSSLLKSETGSEEASRSGLWLTRNSGPEADNFLTVQHSLHHHLLVQGLVEFISSPSTAVTVTTNHGKEIGKFWSNGKNWCTAVFNLNMFTEIQIETETPNSGDYVLIDKIILGVMGNITYLNGRTINPCKTSHSTSTSADESLIAPEMSQLSPPGRRSYQPPQLQEPDMAIKPTYTGGRPVQGPPDMKEDRIPRYNTRTTTDNNVEDNDSSEVKCGCSCSCSRQKSKNPSMTMTG